MTCEEQAGQVLVPGFWLQFTSRQLHPRKSPDFGVGEATHSEILMWNRRPDWQKIPRRDFQGGIPKSYLCSYKLFSKINKNHLILNRGLFPVPLTLLQLILGRGGSNSGHYWGSLSLSNFASTKNGFPSNPYQQWGLVFSRAFPEVTSTLQAPAWLVEFGVKRKTGLSYMKTAKKQISLARELIVHGEWQKEMI